MMHIAGTFKVTSPQNWVFSATLGRKNEGARSLEADRLGFQALPLLFNIAWEIPAKNSKQKLKLKDIHIGKEKVKLSLLAGDKYLYTEILRNPHTVKESH